MGILALEVDAKHLVIEKSFVSLRQCKVSTLNAP